MASTDAKPVPQKNVAFRLYFALRDANNDLITTWAGADSEVSKDGAAYSDCTNEATEIGTTGTGYIDLTSTEMNADNVLLKITFTNAGAKTLLFSMYPEEAGDIRVNVTAFGGTAGTFASGRPEVNMTHIAGSAVSASTAQLGVNLVNIAGAAVNTSSAQLGVNVVNAAGTAWGSGAITAASIATGAITSAKFAASAIDATAIASGAITSAKFAASAIDATAIASNAITSAKIASGAITSSTFAAGAINAAAIADGAIDNATFAADTGLQTIRSNTAQAGASTSITLDASASSTTDFYVGAWIYVTGGTGAGQVRVCTAYNGTTKVATVAPAWATNPAAASTFAILQNAQLTGIQGNVTGNVTGSTGSISGVTFPSNFASLGINGSGHISRVTLVDTTTTNTDMITAAGIRSAVGLASANLDTQLTTIDDFLDTEIAAIKAKTDTIPTFPTNFASLGINASGHITRVVLVDTTTTNTDMISAAGIRSAVGLASANLDTQLTTIDDFLDTEVAAIKAVTDKLDTTMVLDGAVYQFTANALELAPSGGGGSTDWTADERTAIRAILGIPGSGTTPADPTTGILDTIRDLVVVVDGIVDDILVDTGTTLQAELDGIQADTEDIQTRLPAALVSGRMDASVGAYQTGLTPLQPTVAGRTLDVSTTGEAGIDWANIGSPTTAVNLSGTNIDVDQVVASVSGAVASVTGNVGGNVAGSVGSVTGNVSGSVGSVVGSVGGNVGGSVASIGAGGITASSIATDAITAAKIAADAVTEIQNGLATAANLATVAGYLDTEIAAILADTNELQTDFVDGGRLDLLIDAIKAKTDNLPSDPADASDIASLFSTVNTKLDTIDDFVDTEVTAIKAVTDKLDTAMELDSTVYRFTTNALEQAPSGGGGGSTDWTADERTAIRSILGIPGSGTTPADPTTGILDTIRDAIVVVDGIVDDILVDTGTTLQAELDGIQADTEDIQTRLPAALVSGRMDASVGAMANNVMTAAALAADAVSEIQSGLATASALSTVAGYLDTEIAAILADTNELQTDWVNGGRLDLLIDGIKAKTDTIPTFPANFASLGITVTGSIALVEEVIDVTGDVAQVGDGGAQMNLIPWNSAWDAEIQSECTDALNAYDPPTNTELEARTLVAANYGTAANQTTILARLGSWTGSGINTILGAFRALMAKASALTPTDISTGTTFDNTTDALEAIRDRGDSAWTTGGGGGGGGTDWTSDEREAIRTILGIPDSGTTPDTPSDGVLSDMLTLTKLAASGGTGTVSVVDNGNGTSTLTFKDTDGTTTVAVVTWNHATGARVRNS